jgi:hypothetical protein
MKTNWHSWVKKYFSTKFKNVNSGFFLVENFFGSATPFSMKLFSPIYLAIFRSQFIWVSSAILG